MTIKGTGPVTKLATKGGGEDPLNATPIAAAKASSGSP
ncbi:hypothetical protein YUYDRAFT_07120 [Streptomyces sp. ScaeMP-e48]|nr:hypothetical protein YUYDRAFT_07120 [Streptomyces sp. ScaeMP-e48]